MSSKLFKESDSWGDSSGIGNQSSLSFKKVQKSKRTKKKEDRAKKRNHEETLEDDPEAGKYVRAPKYYGLEDSDEAGQLSPAKSKREKRKRKLEQEVNNSSPDSVAPQKKLKKKHETSSEASPPEANEKGPESYADKLRESLKGSRFRFLNEQMYKSTGKESMKIFQEDESAFEAYHEGYRHQVENWPMNPLDRIINNLKRL